MIRSVSLALPRPDVSGSKDSDATGLQRWLVALCAIRFDLEQGQLLEECFPPGALTSDEIVDVAFSAFPDSVVQTQRTTSIHDSVFFFRIRRRGTVGTWVSDSTGATGWSHGASPDSGIVASLVSPKLRPRNTVPAAAARGEISGKERGLDGAGPGSGAQRFLYGFVFNRQRHDERLRRGGEQKSVVILSERPYSCVFKPLVQIAGPLFFDVGRSALEKVASYVSRWPPPKHGSTMELPIANMSIRAHLPPAHTLPPGCGTPMDDFTSAMAPAAPLNPSSPQGIFHEVDLFGVLRGVLMELWVLWELVLIGEPLLILAPSPSICSEAVTALASLVAPLPCSVDFRPYFTIHDPDFAHLLKGGGEGLAPMILGVTNLFFLKALRAWPHVLSVGASSASVPANRMKASPNAGGSAHHNPRQLHIALSLSRLSPSNLLKVARPNKDGPLCLMSEHREALWSSYDATTKPDTSILNRLVDAAPSPRIDESMAVVNNEILRRHFLEVTTNFLAPFGPYLRAAAPREGTSPFADPPPLPPFDAHHFLEKLATRGPGKFLAKRLRPNWLDLYRRFVGGPNFMPWFQRRRAVAEKEQHRIWRHARAKGDIRAFVTNMSEVEVVDSFHGIVRHLVSETQMLQRAGLANAETPICQKLRSDLRVIFNLLPKDMQQLLLFNPQHAALLQSTREFTKLPGRPSVHIAWCSESPSMSRLNSPLGVSRSSLSQELASDPLDLDDM